jgi:urocanate hydratase
MVRRRIVPDVLTDQTSAHDALNGYVPHGMSFEEAVQLRSSSPDEYVERSMQSMAVHVQAMLDLQKAGAVTFDYGNNIRTQARKAGVENAFDIPGFVPEYIRPLFCEGKGPFGGSRSAATRRISRGRIGSRSRCSRKTSCSRAG